MARHCVLKAGHEGPCQWGRFLTGYRRSYVQSLARGITPTEPPCIGGLIARRMAELRSGQLGRSKGEA